MECFANPDAVATDGQIAFLMFVASAVGTAGQYLLSKSLEWWRERRGERAASQTTIVNHLQSLVTRLDAEKLAAGRDKEVAEEQRRKEEQKNNRCRISAVGMRRHIRYLEALLSNAKAPYVAYEEEVEEGSDVHIPLPATPPTEDS